MQALLHQEGWIEDVRLSERVNQKVYVNADGRVFAMQKADANVGFVYSSREHFLECVASLLGLPGLAARLGYEVGEFQAVWADLSAVVGRATDVEEFIARAREFAQREPGGWSQNFVVRVYALGELIKASDPKWNWCLEYERGRISRITLYSENERMELSRMMLRLFPNATVRDFDFRLALTLTGSSLYPKGQVDPDPPIMNRFHIVK